jgi:uncharacterized OB-fold protein
MAGPERAVADLVVPLDYTYNYRVGPYLEKYIQELGNKKIMAVKCPKCDKVAVPPREICGWCRAKMDEWVEVGPDGTVENFTIAHVWLNKGAVERIDKPKVIAMVMLDGATVPLAGWLEAEPSSVKKGMKVKAVFKEPAENALTDLSHFEPV